jgi:hypothetical protein
VSLTIASWSSHTPQNKKINSGFIRSKFKAKCVLKHFTRLLKAMRE